MNTNSSTPPFLCCKIYHEIESTCYYLIIIISSVTFHSDQHDPSPPYNTSLKRDVDCLRKCKVVDWHLDTLH